MSGQHGWGGNDNRNSGTNYNYGGGSSGRHSSSSDDSAYSGYNPPSRAVNNPPANSRRVTADVTHSPSSYYQSQVMPQVPADYVDVKVKKVVATKPNVILIGLDVTGSMSSWIPEIFKFLPLLHKEASSMLSGETEILFASFGDGEHGDKLLTAPFGSDQSLDSFLAAVRTAANGGGNYVETPESFLYYIDKYVELTAAKQVFTFIVTDEGIKKDFSPSSWKAMTGEVFYGEAFSNADLIRRLRLKTEIATIFSGSDAYYGSSVSSMKDSWRGILPEGSLLEMPRANLVVETMLAFIATRINKMDVFKTQYADRRGDTQYGDENLNTVLKSVALVPQAGGLSPTKNIALGTKSLFVPGGTKSIGTQAVKNIAGNQTAALNRGDDSIPKPMNGRSLLQK